MITTKVDMPKKHPDQLWSDETTVRLFGNINIILVIQFNTTLIIQIYIKRAVHINISEGNRLIITEL